MTLLAAVKSVNKVLKPYYDLLGMIGFFILLFWAAYKFVVKPPDLGVTIVKKDINYPKTINDNYTQLYQFVFDSTKNNTAKINATAIWNYLIKTKTFWEITIRNSTRKQLDNIRIRITNVSTMTAFAMSSTYFLGSEVTELLKKVEFNQSSGIIHLDNIDELPAKADLTFYVWGDIPDINIGQNIFIFYNGGSARINKIITVGGFKAYLVDYIYEILILIFLIFFIVYKRAIKISNVVN